MGYTHYWRDMPAEHSEARWEMFVEAVKHVHEELPDFAFCKTARKPYDLLVCSTLLLYKHFWPEVQISSDGDFEDWESAIEHVKNVTGLHIDIFNNIDQIKELV